MINKFYQNSNIEKFIIIIFPLLLITGPALPDITAVLLSIYFLLFKIKNLVDNNNATCTKYIFSKIR